MAAVIPDLMPLFHIGRWKKGAKGKSLRENGEKAHFMRKTRAYSEDSPRRFFTYVIMARTVTHAISVESE